MAELCINVIVMYEHIHRVYFANYSYYRCLSVTRYAFVNTLVN